MQSLLAWPAAAGTATPAQPAAGARPKVLRHALRVAETGFDPAQVTDLYSRIVTAHIFDGRYRYDHLARPFKIKPGTAAAMPQASNDVKRRTIRVRPGICFADDPVFNGTKRELVAEDYVCSLRRFFDPRWKAPAYASPNDLKMPGVDELREVALKNETAFDYDTPVEGMRALDRDTIQFRFAEPRPRFAQTLAGGDLDGAAARAVVEAYGDRIMDKPLGTGAFRLGRRRRSSPIVLERNGNFRELNHDAEPNADDVQGRAMRAKFKGRRLPMIGRVEISIVEEQQPRRLAFLQRQHDMIERLPEELVNLAIPNNKLAPNLARQGVQMYRVLASDITLAVFIMDPPVTGGHTPDKVALRRAPSLASNTDQQIRPERKGQAIPAHSPLVPNTYGYDPLLRSEAGAYDLARARALLDTFGYVDKDGDGWRELPDGSPLVLEIATQPDQTSRRLDELMRRDMTALGVRTGFKPAQWPQNLKNVRAHKYVSWRVGSAAGSADGQGALMRGFSRHLGGQNLARLKNDEFDRIFSRMNDIEDGPERLKLLREAKRILLAYAPYKNGVHRILTDRAHPWRHGYRSPPCWQEWWRYVDLDADAQAQASR